MVMQASEQIARQYANGNKNKRDWGSIYNLKSNGGVGDGITDDSRALQNAFDSDSELIYIPEGKYYIPSGKILTITKPKYIWGPGKIIGPTVANMGGPSCVIKIHGSLGTSVNYGSTISKHTKLIAVSNSFVKDQLLMISNYPTDASDAYTAGSTDMLGNVTRNYSTFSTSNLRQTRRKEIGVIASANASQFILRSGTLHDYTSTSQLKFELVKSVDNVVFDGVTFENVWIDAKYCRNLGFYKCNAYSCLFAIQTSINVTCDFIDFDSRDTAGRLNIFESSRFVRITGHYRGTHTPSDNGVIATCQTSDLSIDVVVEGTDGTYGHGVHIDNNFTENWTGYTDVPSSNINITVVGRGFNGSTVIATCDPYAGYIQNMVINAASDDSSIQLNGVNGAILNVAMLNNTINLYGCTNVDIYGKHGIVYQGTYTNPRNSSQVSANTNIRFNQSGIFLPTVKGSTSAGTATYTVQKGDYIRTGKQVTVWIYLNWSGATGTGNWSIGSLPYPIKSDNNYFVSAAIGYSTNISSSGIQVVGYGTFGSSEISMGQIISGGAFSKLPVPTSGEIILSMTYEVD